jgi:2-methylisocitrate lyase-like PEP mutase family enzyme
MVRRTVQLYATTGIAGLHIEDRMESEQGEHSKSMDLISQNEFTQRISAAVAARKEMGSDVVIIARSDALNTLGFEEAIRRLKAARAHGADAGFLYGVRTKEEAAKVVKELNFPALLNMTYGGSTPDISVNEAQEMGYAAIIFPLASISPASRAIRGCLEGLKQNGKLGSDDKRVSSNIAHALERLNL